MNTFRVLCFIILSQNIFAQKIIYVNLTATGNNTGSTWQNAYTNLSTALNIADQGDSIFVLKGTYLPSINDRTEAFILKKGVCFFGGFVGTEKKPSERKLPQNITILSGDIGIEGDSTDNSYNILRGVNIDSTTLIDGFRFTKANSNGGDAFTPYTSNLVCGGGIYLSVTKDNTGKLILRNSEFISNTSKYDGAAIFSYTEKDGIGDSYEISNCIFFKNRAYSVIKFHAYDFINTTYNSKIDNSSFIRTGYYAPYAIYGYTVPKSVGNLFENFTGELFFESITKSVFKNCKGINVYGLNITDSCYFYKSEISFTFGLVKNCTFENNSTNPYNTDFTSYENCVFKDYTFNIETPYYIKNCIFENYNDRIVGIRGEQNSNEIPVSISNCIFRNNKNLLLGTFSNTAVGYQSSVYLSNNTFYNNDCEKNKNVLIYSGFGNCSLYLQNNIFVNAQKNRFRVRNSGNVNIENCIFNTDDKDLIVPDSVYDFNTNTYIVYSGTAAITNCLFNASPDFKAANDNDFSLLPCSKAINIGKKIDAKFETKTDFSNKPRTRYGAIDIGAYEYQDFKVSNFSTKPSFCTSKEGSFLPILQGNCSKTPAISWENAQNQTGNGGDKLASGTYTFFIKDTNGCADTIKNILIEDKGNISADFNIFNTSGTNAKNGSIAVTNVNNGKAPFKYIWSNGDTTKTIKNLAAGDYKVTISDANGCLFSTTLTIKAASALSDIFTGNISVTPNPASDKITFHYDTAHFANDLFITFYDLQGKIILPKQKLNANEQIDVSYFVSGLYFCQITDNQHLITKKIIILH